jgi:uncharacterized protein (TIGR02284 family)
METTTETIEILNDLVQINNDRITGYERALKEDNAKDSDLRNIFFRMIDESRKIRMALANEVHAFGGELEMGSTNSGKIYRAWMDVKAVFTGHNSHTVLANCEAGEDAAQKAYRTALESKELPAYIRDLITAQQMELKESHNRIKTLRDQAQ